jgi:Tol biopolymer transport system component
LRFVNKTKSLNVTGYSRQKKRYLADIQNEDYNSFIMQPSEIREGLFKQTKKNYVSFAKTNATADKAKRIRILILNIKTYEL